jgi:hypothetical protein
MSPDGMPFIGPFSIARPGRGGAHGERNVV